MGENTAPGGGSKTLRHQLKILSDFLHGFELEKLHPDISCVKSSPGLIPYVLSDKNNSYAVFLRAIGTDRTKMKLTTGDGNYRVQALNTFTGSYTNPVRISPEEGIITIEIEIPEGELALKIIRE